MQDTPTPETQEDLEAYVPVTTQVPKRIRNTLRDLARKEGLSVSAYVRRMLKSYVAAIGRR